MSVLTLNWPVLGQHSRRTRHPYPQKYVPIRSQPNDDDNHPKSQQQVCCKADVTAAQHVHRNPGSDNANSVNNNADNVNNVNNNVDSVHSVNKSANNGSDNVNSVNSSANNGPDNVNSVNSVNRSANNDADNTNGNVRSNGAPLNTTPTYSKRSRHHKKTNSPSAIAGSPATVTIVEQQHAVVANTKKTKQRLTSQQSSRINLLPVGATNGKENIRGKSSENVILDDNNSSIPVTSPPATAAAAAAVPKAKSWASLFKPASSSPSSASVINGESSRSKTNNLSSRQIPEQLAVNGKNNNNGNADQPVIDPVSYRLGEYLLDYTVDSRTINLQPRGLINRSNYCYINSILQALLACPPLYNLLSGLNVVKDKSRSTPIIDGLCSFVGEFEPLSANQHVNRRRLKNQRRIGENFGSPFEPVWMHNILTSTRNDSFGMAGRQEDAEEFLGCLLNGLNNEISKLMDLSRDYYQRVTEMRPKSNGSITRQTKIGKTPISEIFGGLLKSEIHRAGDRPTFNIQPFFTLQLNIKKVRTVEQALEALVVRNQLQGLTSSETNEEVDAWQQVKLEELPVILILQLVFIEFRMNGGCTKIIKALEFPVDLEIDQRLLSSKPKGRQYKLFAVTSHVGMEANRGHFITDTFSVGYDTWLRLDDGSVEQISEEQMLHPQGTQVPYLLFYKRTDMINNNRINNANSNRNVSSNSNNKYNSGKTW